MNFCCNDLKIWWTAIEEMEGDNPEYYGFNYCPFCGSVLTLTFPSDGKEKETSKSS